MQRIYNSVLQKQKGENRREKVTYQYTNYKDNIQYTIKTTPCYAIEEREFLSLISHVLHSTFVQLAEYKNEHRMY